MSRTPQLNFLKDGDCMSTLMIFMDWARHIKIRKTKEMREIKLTESATTENPSARLDIDMEGAVSRITCWEKGTMMQRLLILILSKQFIQFMELCR